MAFMDFTGFAAARVGSSSEKPAASSPNLSALEIAAVQLGEHDDLSSIRRHGRASNWIRAAFGWRTPTPLADPVLEAVRRLSVAAHLGNAGLIDRVANEAIATGLSALAISAVLDRFAISRNAPKVSAQQVARSS